MQVRISYLLKLNGSFPCFTVARANAATPADRFLSFAAHPRRPPPPPPFRRPIRL